MAYWKASPHQFGPGKVHIIHPEDANKTLCGVRLKFCPGEYAEQATATCLGCGRSFESQQERKAEFEKYKSDTAARQQEQEEKKRQWQAEYNAYLRSPEWNEKRAAVIKRANAICEACGQKRATYVRHISWQHVFHEPLFELVAVCSDCHEELTALDKPKE